MAEIKNAEIGIIGLIQQLENGSIIQLGMNEEQSNALQLFVASLSRQSPLVKIGGQNELIPKHLIKNPAI